VRYGYAIPQAVLPDPVLFVTLNVSFRRKSPGCEGRLALDRLAERGMDRMYAYHKDKGIAHQACANKTASIFEGSVRVYGEASHRIESTASILVCEIELNHASGWRPMLPTQRHPNIREAEEGKVERVCG
jgi:hypothetical protein